MYADSNESGQDRLEWLEILKMKQNEFSDPDFFYVFNIILSFSNCSQSFKKICTWELLGANFLKEKQNQSNVSRENTGSVSWKAGRAIILRTEIWDFFLKQC